MKPLNLERVYDEVLDRIQQSGTPMGVELHVDAHTVAAIGECFDNISWPIVQKIARRWPARERVPE